MAKFDINDKVIHVSTNEEGIVVKVFPAARGKQLYTVNFGGVDKSCSEGNLTSNYNVADPIERIKQGKFGSNLEFVRINTSNKLTNTTNSTISSLKASKSLFRAYQFKPLLKFLNSDNRRLLIADEVGLGKTIEAGHIMFELCARGEMRSAIIVCPKSLQEKWRAELKDKFNFSFKVYESTKDLVADIQQRHNQVKAIINYEKIRPRESKDEKKESQSLFDVISEHRSKFDLAIFDEAHKLRNRETQTFKGAQNIVENSESVIFLTATPIMISEENLFNLLHLLNRVKYSSYEIFRNGLEINKPFLQALHQLSNNDCSLDDIAEELNAAEVTNYGTYTRTTIGELFAGIPIYQEVIKNLDSAKDSAAQRVQLQFDISSLNQMNNIFTRTRKRDITKDWSQAVRDPHTRSIELCTAERIEYDNILDEYIEDNGYIDEYGCDRMSYGQSLGLVQRKRQVASSVYGFLNRVDDLNKGIDAYADCEDAKVNELLRIIEEVVTKRGKKLIIFALFKNTLKYLTIRLNKKGFNTAVIHGDIKERDDVLYSFKNDESVQILLSSEVGSEGLDLQFCDALVNYDLPWNPMVVEQRIGRIDRFGQESPKVHIYNLVVANSIQEKIYSRLLDRIGIFKGCIGDLETILDTEIECGNARVTSLREYFNSIEKDLYCNDYTEEERNVKIDAIEKAIITEKRNLEQIESGLTNTLTNDSYFENEIRNIQKNFRYITDTELLLYLKAIIRDCLTTCQIRERGESRYIFSMPKSNRKELSNFLTTYQPMGEEFDIIFKQFKNRIADLSEFEITFNQEQAYKDKKLIYINIYHPIVVAILNYYRAKSDSCSTTFRFYVDAQRFDADSKIVAGEYYLAIYNYALARTALGRSQRREIIRAVIYDRINQVVIDNQDICEEFMGKSQLYAAIYDGTSQCSSDDVDTAYAESVCAIEEVVEEEFRKAKIEMDSNSIMESQRIKEYYDYRIAEQETKVRELEWESQWRMAYIDEDDQKKHRQKIAGHKGEITSLQRQCEERLEQIKNNDVRYESAQLISLSQVVIK